MSHSLLLYTNKGGGGCQNPECCGLPQPSMDTKPQHCLPLQGEQQTGRSGQEMTPDILKGSWHTGMLHPCPPLSTSYSPTAEPCWSLQSSVRNQLLNRSTVWTSAV